MTEYGYKKDNEHIFSFDFEYVIKKTRINQYPLA